MFGYFSSIVGASEADPDAAEVLPAEREGDRPMAKTSARPRLRAYEQDPSTLREQQSGPAQADRPTYNPFMAEEAAAPSNLRKQPDIGPVDSNLRLKAYEEQVLKIKQPARQQPQGQGGDGERSHAGSSSEGLLAVQNKTAGDSSDEDLMVNNSLARSSDLIPTSGQWEVGKGRGAASWKPGKELGTFDGYMKSVIVTYHGSQQCMNMDITAKLMITSGERAGILVRGPDRKARSGTVGADGYLVVYVRWPKVGDSGSNGSLTVAISRGPQAGEEELRTWKLDEADRDKWHTLRVRAYQDTLTCFFDRKLIGHTQDPSPRTGCIGLWASESSVRVRGISLAILDELQKEMAKSRDVFKELEREKMLHERDLKVQRFSRIRAAKLIQQIFRAKLAHNKERMLAYHQAEEEGFGDEMRKQMLVVWLLALGAMKKLDDAMLSESDIREKRCLPKETSMAPKRRPRTQLDEELHREYERKRKEYKSQWEEAGQQVLGTEAFQEMLKTMGPAQQKKKLIAKAFLKQAKEAATEEEHKSLLRKAMRLKDDYAENMEDLAKIMSKPIHAR